MTQKIVLIGAGSANFGLEAVSDIYRSKILQIKIKLQKFLKLFSK